MAKSRGDFTDVLLRRKILSPEQLDEACQLQQRNKIKLQDAIAQLQYATTVEVSKSMAEFHGVPFVDLTRGGT